MIGLPTNPTIRQQIVLKLKEISELKEVTGAVNLKTVMTNQDNLPGAYVLETHMQTSENQYANGLLQTGSIGFAVVLSIENIKDDFGADSSDKMTALRGLVLDKLLGFAPTDAVGDTSVQLEYGGGRVIGFENDILVWQENYILPEVTLWSNQ